VIDATLRLRSFGLQRSGRHVREMANTCECVAEVSTFCNTAIVMDREYSGFGHAAAVIGFEVQKLQLRARSPRSGLCSTVAGQNLCQEPIATDVDRLRSVSRERSAVPPPDGRWPWRKGQDTPRPRPKPQPPGRPARKAKNASWDGVANHCILRNDVLRRSASSQIAIPACCSEWSGSFRSRR